MKPTNILLLALLVSCVLSACATKIHQHTLPCHNRTSADVIRSFTSVLVLNGFRITHSDTIVGLVQAQTDESRDLWTGALEQRVWQVVLKPQLSEQPEVTAGGSLSIEVPVGKEPLFIQATAKVISKTQNAFGATLTTNESYFADDTDKNATWYWDVRKGIENLCGSIAVITTKKSR